MSFPQMLTAFMSYRYLVVHVAEWSPGELTAFLDIGPNPFYGSEDASNAYKSAYRAVSEKLYTCLWNRHMATFIGMRTGVCVTMPYARIDMARDAIMIENNIGYRLGDTIATKHFGFRNAPILPRPPATRPTHVVFDATGHGDFMPASEESFWVILHPRRFSSEKMEKMFKAVMRKATPRQTMIDLAAGQ